MRVLLVHPHLFHHPAPSLPSGLAWLGAALRTRGSHVALLDLAFVWNRSRAIPRAIEDFGPDLIGIGVPYLDNECAFHSISFLPQIRWVADRLRASARAPVVAGGSGITRFPTELLTYLGLRHGFAGGDVVNAAQWIESIGDVGGDDEIPGSIRWDGSAYRLTPGSPASTRHREIPAAAAHDLIDYPAYLARGGAAVIPVSLPGNGTSIRRDPAELDYEIGALQASSPVARVLYAGLTVGRDPSHDDPLLERLAARDQPPPTELLVEPAALTAERLRLARAAGARALRMRLSPLTNPATPTSERGTTRAELEVLSTALERVGRSLPVIVELPVGGPDEIPWSLAATLAFVETPRPHPPRIVLEPGQRIWSIPAPGVVDRRGGVAGESFLWPRFGFAAQVEAGLLGRLRNAVRARPGSSVDADAYAPWRRLAHALSRRLGPWPAWRLDPLLADLPKRARAWRIERVPFRNQPR